MTIGSLCSIWYSYETENKIWWGVAIWNICLTSWCKSRIEMDHIKGTLTIPWPNHIWNQTLHLKYVMNIIGPKMFEEVNEKLTDMYVFHTKDMRRCPNTNCNNAGFIKLKPCIKRTECPECQLKWREIAQMTLYHKLSKHIKEGF